MQLQVTPCPPSAAPRPGRRFVVDVVRGASGEHGLHPHPLTTSGGSASDVSHHTRTLPTTWKRVPSRATTPVSVPPRYAYHARSRASKPPTSRSTSSVLPAVSP